jgi:hypothetical protein
MEVIRFYSVLIINIFHEKVLRFKSYGFVFCTVVWFWCRVIGLKHSVLSPLISSIECDLCLVRIVGQWLFFWISKEPNQIKPGFMQGIVAENVGWHRRFSLIVDQFKILFSCLSSSKAIYWSLVNAKYHAYLCNASSYVRTF